jgi:O-antigen/teichoic acid export membrane protein
MISLGTTTRRWHRAHRQVEVAPSPQLVKRMLSYGLANMLSGGVWVAIAQLDVFFISIFKGRHAAGLYQPTSQLASMVLSLPPLIGGFLLPLLARAAARRDTAEVRRLYHWASRWSIAFCAPALGTLIAAPGPILGFLFGHAYISLTHTLLVLAAGDLVYLVLGFNGAALDAHGVPKLVATRGVMGLVLNMALCVVLIPRIGFLGAATATSGTLIFVNVLNSKRLQSAFHVPPWDRPQFFTIVAFLASLEPAHLAVSLLSHNELLAVIAAAVITGGTTLAASVVAAGRDERRSIRQHLQSIARRVIHFRRSK